ncbi:hypothetical protein [Nonomuraea insulae]
MLTHLGPANPDDLRKLASVADRAGALIAVDLPFAADRTWTAALPRLRQAVQKAALLRSLVTTTEPATLPEARLAQLAMIRAILDEVPSLTAASAHQDHYALTASEGRMAITVTAVVSPSGPPRHTLDLLGTDQHWHVDLTDEGPAHPAHITLADATGQHTTRPVFETGRRAAWIALFDALTGDRARLTCSIAELAELAEQCPS